MAKFLKLDLADEDEPCTGTLEADNMESLLQSEYDDFLVDDRFCPCHGIPLNETFMIQENSVHWSPGDGGEYTVALYYPDTPEGRTELAKEEADREE